MIAGLVILVCYIMVVIAMFKSGDTVLGIVSIVFCFIGHLIALVMGWVNADKWNVRWLMPIYTGAYLTGVVLRVMLKTMVD